ncbi:unnamed protein product [Effrenium voratum]|uniref:Pseudouridine synthase RsuA/RluA-like domain-containing protein n=1 Tax=Effrenium voratum TaxID=2562239 RepID=A0AA36NH41_9DINO|nr:unnamed protein product [Effrenium voratum]
MTTSATPALMEPRQATQFLGQVARKRPPVAALQTLRELQLGRLQANAFHYGALIAACSKSRGGHWPWAAHLLKDMGHRLIQSDMVNCNSAISACERTGQWEVALSFLQLVQRQGVPETITWNAAIGACGRAGQWERAVAMLSAFEKDEVSFSSAMAACEKAGEWAWALHLLGAMRLATLRADVFSFSAATSACAKAGKWQLACGLFARMARSMSPDSVSYGSLIKACEAGNRWISALNALETMETTKVPLNEVICNSAISACSAGSRWEHALAIFHSMPRRNIVPQVVGYNAAISACVRGSSWNQGMAIFQEMPAAGVPPDQISFNSALSACQRSSNWQQALALIELMPRSSVAPEEFCFTTALSCCEGWQLCLQLLSGFEDSQITPLMLGVVMSACETAGAWEASLSLLQHLLARRATPDALHVGSAANALRRAQGFGAALRLLEAMKATWAAEMGDVRQMEEVWSPKCLQAGHGVLACMKPEGITTEDFVQELAEDLQEQLGIVSRLDQPTSGALMVARGHKGSTAANWLQAQFASRLVDKKYLCLCEGPVLGQAGATGAISAALCTDEAVTVVSPEGREALTLYNVLATYAPPSSGQLTLLEVKPVTGRTHQIRVHLAHLGRPLVGDLTYGKRDSAWPCGRLFLHCRRVRLRDLAGREFCAVASLPASLRQVLDELKPFLQA